MESKKFLLQEKDIPTAWYNIVADMKNKPLPPLNPQTKKPLTAEDLYPLFAKGLVEQELNETDAWIEIPEEVRDMYKIWLLIHRHTFISRTKVSALLVRIN